MKFLLTNDDGIDAPGLAALARALASHAETVVVAPDSHLSGCSHQVSTSRPLHVREVDAKRYSVDGTPVDCTRLGTQHLAADADWVISGINEGGNLGADIHVSGTVAAVREAALLGVPAIAFSHYRRAGAAIDWVYAESLVPAVLRKILARPATPGTFWNVNFPHCAERTSEPEIIFCPLDLNPLPVSFELVEGRYHYRGVYHDRLRTPGSDVDVCFSGNIAVTQLHLGVTLAVEEGEEGG